MAVQTVSLWAAMKLSLGVKAHLAVVARSAATTAALAAGMKVVAKMVVANAGICERTQAINTPFALS